MYKLFLLGFPTMIKDGQPTRIRRRLGIAMLSYLARQPRPQSREALATFFWPEQPRSKALTSLRRELARLREDVGADLLLADRQAIEINPAAELWVDVDAFEAGMEETETAVLRQTVQLHTDAFLSGFTLPNAPQFDEWQRYETEKYRTLLATGLERLASRFVEQGDVDAAIGATKRWLLLDTLHEPAHRRLMQLLAQAGKIGAAVLQYQLCAQILDSELGLKPEPATEALLANIQSRQTSSLSELTNSNQEQRPLPLTSTIHNPLPAFADAFVGRQEEIGQIHHHLTQAGNRLLTLRGLGGMGKTRLAVAALHALARAEHFADGLFFVDLSGVEEDEFLVPSIAQALACPLARAIDPLTQLVEHIQAKQILICLDNFEQLQRAARTLTELLQKCPNLSLLVTSRHQLKLTGEVVMLIDGLPTTDLGAEPESAEQLFVERALQQRPAIDVAAERPFARAICALLGGMPLAIELSAAWIETLSSQEILAEIHQGLDLLETDAPDIPERQQSIRTVFETSFRLLSLAERQILLKLAVFRGGFERTGAAYVAQAQLRHLRALVEKSLLTVYKVGETSRYHLHPLLRQFALEKLAQHQREEARRRHAHFFAERLAELAKKKCTIENKEIETAVFADVENVRAAWRWIDQQIEAKQASQPLCRLVDQLLTAWYYAYLHQNQFLEGKQQLLKLHQGMTASQWEMGTPEEKNSLGMVAATLATFCFNLAETRASVAFSEQAVKLFADRQNDRFLAYALHAWGLSCSQMGRFELAKAKLEESIRLSQDDSFVPFTMLALGSVYQKMGAFEQSMTQFLASLAPAERCHEGMALMSANINVGSIYRTRGEAKTAVPYFKRAIALARETKKDGFLMVALTTLATSLAQIDAWEAVDPLFAEAMQLADKRGKRRWQGEIARRQSLVLLERGQHRQAADSVSVGLQRAIDLDFEPDKMAGLFPLAQWQAQNGRFHEALLALGVIRESAAAEAEVRQQADALWDELTSELPPSLTKRAEQALETAELDILLPQLMAQLLAPK